LRLPPIAFLIPLGSFTSGGTAVRHVTKREPDRLAWDRNTLHRPHVQPDKAARVECMFDAIAPTYELVNRFLSLGGDARWRRRAIRAAAVHSGDVALDVCCGTGDMVRGLVAAVPPPGLVLALDFSARMLAAGRFDGAGVPVQVLRADALRLPLATASVDVITCAFGVRNFGDLQAGLVELQRVARPGARLVILEFALPERPVLRWGYRLYCEYLLPTVGAFLSHDRVGAYRYLARSIGTFETVHTMVGRLRDAGFGDLDVRRMNFGSVVLYRCVKPGIARSEARP
jgi:demethylmenaquinone methyltransferase / 2-methoxy-6-polyprenyl-1,4-benzoquinol methylase